MSSEILHTFSPDSSDRMYMWIGIVVTIIALALSYYFLRQPKRGHEHNKSVLIAMLFFFTGLLAGGTAFFSGWSVLKQGKVVIEQDQMRIGNTAIPYDQIAKIYYKKDKQVPLFQGAGGSTTVMFLVIEEKAGAIYALSEQQFPIGEIRTKIQEATSGTN